jgi:hypothetical protein
MKVSGPPTAMGYLDAVGAALQDTFVRRPNRRRGLDAIALPTMAIATAFHVSKVNPIFSVTWKWPIFPFSICPRVWTTSNQTIF